MQSAQRRKSTKMVLRKIPQDHFFDRQLYRFQSINWSVYQTDDS